MAIAKKIQGARAKRDKTALLREWIESMNASTCYVRRFGKKSEVRVADAWINPAGKACLRLTDDTEVTCDYFGYAYEQREVSK